MTLGPLEYTVIGFENNRFDGSIADEILRVIDTGTIALVDAVVITKDADGGVEVVEFDNTQDPRFASFAPLLDGLSGLLTPDDIDKVADGLPPRTTALALLFEHKWAVRIKEAIARADGFLIARETIPPEILQIVNAELEAEAVSA